MDAMGQKLQELLKLQGAELRVIVKPQERVSCHNSEEDGTLLQKHPQEKDLLLVSKTGKILV